MAPVTDTVDRINEPLRRSFTILEPVKTTSNDNTIRDVMKTIHSHGPIVKIVML
jgi:hypothetical protein